MEKYEEDAPRARQGATTTRAAARLTLEPVLRQSITIVQDSTTNPPSYNVTSGALVLSFRLLFLRDPGQGEGDLVFSIPDLQVYAAHVWDQVRD